MSEFNLGEERKQIFTALRKEFAESPESIGVIRGIETIIFNQDLKFIRRLKLQIAKYGMIKDKNTYQRTRMAMANCILEDLDKLAGANG